MSTAAVAEKRRRVRRWRRGKRPKFDRARLPPHEVFGVALQGLRTRKLRAALSALGIAIGIGAMVAVVGVSASAQANLIAEIDSLGTNLLTVSPGTNFLGNNEVLPTTSVPMIGRVIASTWLRGADGNGIRCHSALTSTPKNSSALE